MERQEKLKLVFEEAKRFLKKTGNLAFPHETNFRNITDANERLIKSLSNRDRMANVIGFEKRRPAFKKVLLDFDPVKILRFYPNGDLLLAALKKAFHLSLDIKNSRSLWRVFANGVISGSRFLASFENADSFHSFVKLFDYNKYTRAALPMLLSKELKGFGFPLACDFLKELGYRCYPKPDRHLINIFFGLKLSESRDPYDVYKTINEMSEVAGEDAYNVDKLFWLIGREGRADEFIQKTNRILKQAGEGK